MFSCFWRSFYLNCFLRGFTHNEVLYYVAPQERRQRVIGRLEVHPSICRYEKESCCCREMLSQPQINKATIIGCKVLILDVLRGDNVYFSCHHNQSVNQSWNFKYIALWLHVSVLFYIRSVYSKSQTEAEAGKFVFHLFLNASQHIFISTELYVYEFSFTWQCF